MMEESRHIVVNFDVLNVVVFFILVIINYYHHPSLPRLQTVHKVNGSQHYTGGNDW